MTQKLLLIITTAVCLSASICFAGTTATISNKTNYSCPTFPTYNPGQCVQSAIGSDIQAKDAANKPVGNILKVGASGPAPISNNTLKITAGFFPSSLIGAQAGHTYYVVTNTMMGGPTIVKTAP